MFYEGGGRPGHAGGPDFLFAFFKMNGPAGDAGPLRCFAINDPLELELCAELDLAGFAEAGGDCSVEVEGQRTRKASLVAVVEEVEDLEDAFEFHPLGELKRF